MIINLPCFQMTVNTDTGDITSHLHAYSENEEFNAGASAIESMVLACARAGIDIASPAFVQSIDDAVESLLYVYDCHDEPDEE